MTLLGALIIMVSLIVVIAGGAFLATALARSRPNRAADPPAPSRDSANGAAPAAPEQAIAAPPPSMNGHDELERERAALTQRRDELERADRLRNLLVSKMSHDLRTPLNSVITLSQLMFEGNSGPLSFEQRKYVEVIQRSGKSLLALIGDILDLAALETGRLDLEVAPIDARTVVRDVAERAAELARRKGLPLRTNAPRTPVPVRADEDRLRHVLLSLVEHAVAQTNNGYVELDVIAPGTGPGAGPNERVRFLITDTGAGDARAARTQALEDFVASPGLAATASSLSLLLADRLVKVMGGELSVETVPGEGTTFVVSLPAAAAEEVAAAAPPAVRDDERTAPGGSTLLIEDDDLERAQVAGLLERAGYQVTQAKSGDEGLGLLRERRFDAVVLDLVMPGMTGLDVLRSARADERLARLPFVVLSALYMTKSERDVLGPGVAAVVRKGDGIGEELLAHVDRAIRAERAIRAATAPDVAPRAPKALARVLVVEDDDDNLFTIRQVLAGLPVDLDTAATGLEAIEICRCRCPDLVLMDVELPGISGLDATRDIRRLPLCGDLPIIALTARTTSADREQALAARFSEYLPKPVRPSDVLSAVSRALHLPAPPERSAGVVSGTAPPR